MTDREKQKLKPGDYVISIVPDEDFKYNYVFECSDDIKEGKYYVTVKVDCNGRNNGWSATYFRLPTEQEKLKISQYLKEFKEFKPFCLDTYNLNEFNKIVIEIDKELSI